MESQDAYRDRVQAEVHEWKAKLDQLKARGEKLEADARIRFLEEKENLTRKLESVQEDLESLKDAGQEQWQNATETIDRAMQEFKSYWENLSDQLSG